MDKPKFSSKKCPRSAEFVLAMREAFGPGVEVAGIREGDADYDPERYLEDHDEQATKTERA